MPPLKWSYNINLNDFSAKAILFWLQYITDALLYRFFITPYPCTSIRKYLCYNTYYFPTNIYNIEITSTK